MSVKSHSSCKCFHLNSLKSTEAETISVTMQLFQFKSKTDHSTHFLQIQTCMQTRWWQTGWRSWQRKYWWVCLWMLLVWETSQSGRRQGDLGLQRYICGINLVKKWLSKPDAITKRLRHTTTWWKQKLFCTYISLPKCNRMVEPRPS